MRPDPVLAIGIAGPRDLPPESEVALRLARVAVRLWGDLLADCGGIVRATPGLYSTAPPRLRIVTRLTGGVDDALAAAALEAGAEVRSVLAEAPPGWSDGGRAPEALIGAADDPFVLGDEPGDPRAQARAAACLLDRSDLLVAAWDGWPDDGRSDVAALVQQALERRMPVLLLTLGDGDEVAMLADPDELLAPAVAADLPRVAFTAQDRARLLARMLFAPPASAYERHALADLLVERSGTTSRRYEYRLLRSLAGRPETAAKPALPRDEEWRRAEAAAALVSPGTGSVVARLEPLQGRLEALAAFYGERARSGVVLRYAMPAVGSFLIGIFAVVAPTVALAWLAVQAVVTMIMVGEGTYSARRRWDERWLDYRSLAERLRCDRFLLPLGVMTARLDAQTGEGDPAWTRWLHQRLRRGVWTGGVITRAALDAAAHHLVSVEIPSQLRYHEAAARRFRSLGRRLRLVGLLSILVTLAVSGLLLAAGPALDGGFAPVEAMLKVALITLPTVFLAARGLRIETRFELSAARSEQAHAALGRVRARLAAGPITYDRVALASEAAAAAMLTDTVEWRIGVQRSRTPFRPEA